MNNTFPIKKNSWHHLAAWQPRFGLHWRRLAALPPVHTGLFRFQVMCYDFSGTSTAYVDLLDDFEFADFALSLQIA